MTLGPPYFFKRSSLKKKWRCGYLSPEVDDTSQTIGSGATTYELAHLAIALDRVHFLCSIDVAVREGFDLSGSDVRSGGGPWPGQNVFIRRASFYFYSFVRWTHSLGRPRMLGQNRRELLNSEAMPLTTYSRRATWGRPIEIARHKSRRFLWVLNRAIAKLLSLYVHHWGRSTVKEHHPIQRNLP